MTDFATARRMMVDGQVRTSDVTDLRIIAAMQELPRERFVPESMRALAYLDFDLPVTADAGARRMLKPMVLAKLIQAVDIDRQARVLDVGCGSGYSAALLARLATSVVALEDDPALAEQARNTLRSLEVANVEVVTGPLPEGWRGGAPYDVILLNGATEVVPERLLHQLGSGGRLVGVAGRPPASKAVVYGTGGGQAIRIFDAA